MQLSQNMLQLIDSQKKYINPTIVVVLQIDSHESKPANSNFSISFI